MPTKTQREREAEQRKAKLDRIQEQVEEGSLTIRKMTDEEKARFQRVRDDRPEATRADRRPGRAPRPKRVPVPPAPRG